MTQITINYNKYTEAIRILQAAHNIQNFFYVKKGFYVLPYFVKNNARVVYFPEININNIKNFWKCAQNAEKRMPGKDDEIINLISSQLTLDYKTTEEFTQTIKGVEKKLIIEMQFFKLFRKIKKVEIRPTFYGTICTGFSSSFAKNLKDEVIIYVRMDASPANVIESLLTDIFHREYYHTNKYEWAEIEVIIDFIIEEHFSDILSKNYLPTIASIRQKQQGKFAADSQAYLKRLGFPQEEIFSIKDHKVCIGDEPVDHILSAEQHSLLHLLVAQKNYKVTYDQIAHTIWQEESFEKYSEYAIAKLIQRLREKLNTIGIPPSRIQSIKKQGYILLD